MGLAGKNKLYGAVVVFYQLKQPFRITKQQVASFIGGEPAGKTKRKSIG
jgi:hypothetical protein